MSLGSTGTRNPSQVGHTTNQINKAKVAHSDHCSKLHVNTHQSASHKRVHQTEIFGITNYQADSTMFKSNPVGTRTPSGSNVDRHPNKMSIEQVMSKKTAKNPNAFGSMSMEGGNINDQIFEANQMAVEHKVHHITDQAPRGGASEVGMLPRFRNASEIGDNRNSSNNYGTFEVGNRPNPLMSPQADYPRKLHHGVMNSQQKTLGERYARQQ